MTIADNEEHAFLWEEMGLAMHDIHHIINDIDAHPDTLLFFEIHVKPKIKEIPPEKPPEQWGPHNGYPLSRRQ